MRNMLSVIEYQYTLANFWGSSTYQGERGTSYA